MLASKNMQLQRLNELIFDEEKIVTSLNVASELKISTSDAQNILNSYVNDNGKLKSEGVHMTYLLCGTLRDGKGAAVYLVKEEDLKDKKCVFDTNLTEMIYSIQKGEDINFNMIAVMNSSCENCPSSLASKNCVKRDVKPKTSPLAQATTNLLKQNEASTSTQVNNRGKSESSIHENKKHTQSSQKQVKSKQNGGIASFFSKTTVKKMEDENKTEISSMKERINNEENIKKEIINDGEKKVGHEEKIETSTESKQNGGIASFFSKTTVKKTEDANKTEISSMKERINNEENIKKEIINDGEKKVGHEEKMETSTEDQTRTVKCIQEKTNKKRKKGIKNNGPNKKRKRIQEICDSDNSSDIFDEEEENEDIIEESDEEPKDVPRMFPIEIPKNKRRKAVDKTYVDEEGFIVTSTEYIYESVSEDEEKDNLKPKLQEKKLVDSKNEKMRGETKLSGNNKGKPNKKPVSGKQSTLMSFFKKN